MSKTKKVLLTIVASMAAGAVIGMLYAPDKGAATRRKLSRLKRRFSCCCEEDDDIDSYDRETLEELSMVLQEQLDKINERLEKDAG